MRDLTCDKLPEPYPSTCAPTGTALSANCGGRGGRSVDWSASRPATGAARMFRPLVIALLSAAVTSAAEPAVKIGAQVDDLRFKDIRHVARSLADFGDKKAYVLVFVQSGCPLAEKYFPVLDRLERAYRDKGVQFAAVNSGPADTIAVMAAQAIEFGVGFPFVKDAECKVADAVGVARTPEVIVLDATRTLRYRGRIDDQYRPGGQRPEPKRRDLVEALNA